MPLRQALSVNFTTLVHRANITLEKESTLYRLETTFGFFGGYCTWKKTNGQVCSEMYSLFRMFRSS
jgi:hypothetical protein